MGSRFLPWTYAVCLACLLSAQSVDLAKGNCKEFDFEKGTGILSKWDKTGHAFDNQPTYGDNARIRDPKINTNVQGDWWIGTFENRSKPYADAGYMTGDYPVGTLTSPKFRITGSKMSFLFGGGCDAGQIRVELLVNGQVARQAFADDCRDRMRRRAWDVGQLKNKFAQIRLVDASRKGHVNFDDLWGDFTCVGNETYNFDSHNSTSFAEKDKEEGEFVLVDEPGLAPVNASLSKSHENSITGTGNEDEFFVVSEPLLFVNRNESDGKPHENPIEGTDDEYVAVQNSSKPHAPRLYKPVTIGKERQEEGIVIQNAEKPNLDLPKYRPLKMGKGPAHQDSLLGGTKISTSNINTQPQPHLQPEPRPRFQAQPKRLTKALSVAKIVKASLHKLSDNSTNKSLLKDDDLRNLTCKSFLVKIKTGKAWDNDFLFTSNGNYQSTRREIEVRVLDAYEDDKDFRGSFFSKFSSSEEPGEIKAFFVLKFRAVGKFLGRLIDQLGPGNVSAAGCLDTSVISQCPSPCPHTCAPSCQSSCCQQYVLTPVLTPVAQCPSPCPQTCAPSCQSSCCQQHALTPVITPVAQCPSPCPKTCAPSCDSSCCQQHVPAPVAQCPSPCPQACAPSCDSSCCQQHVPAPVFTPVTQCPSPCPKTCAPSCDSSCCQQHVPAPVLIPVAQCPSPCPQACAPSCQSSCCQQYGFTPVVPQPVYQPAPVPMPPPPPPPMQMTASRPQLVYEQPAQQWNPQRIAQVYATRPPLTPPPQGLSGSQCATGCSPYCAPNCSPTCCQFLSDNTKRKGDVQTRLRKQQLEEEKR